MEETTENRKFSGEELSFLDFYFLLKAGEQKLRQVQSWNVKNHRSDAKCLPQIPKNTLLVHQTVMIPQVLLRRALRARNTAVFILLGKCSPFFPELCKPYRAMLRSILIQILFFLPVKDVFWVWGSLESWGKARAGSSLQRQNGVELPLSVHDPMLSERSWPLIHTGNDFGS